MPSAIRRPVAHPSPYLPPMPEMMNNPLRSTVVQTDPNRIHPASSTRNGVPPSPASTPTADKGVRSHPQPVVRGRLDEEASPPPSAITLPPPEALGLLPPSSTVGNTNDRKGNSRVPDAEPDQLSRGNPAARSASENGNKETGMNPSPDLQSFGLRQRCERLGITSYRLEKTEGGQWRFLCVLAASSGQAQRELEAVADSQSEAVSALLEHLERTITTTNR
jgi:hypothetical protein